jgi:nickel-dependent lactate racemase
MQVVKIEYGADTLAVELPVSCDSKEMRSVEALADPTKEILRSYRQPIDSPPLSEIARSKLKSRADSRAVIVISDNTRPVPYKGEKGILIPLLQTLREAGYSEHRITLLIGKGSHRTMTDAEVEAMLGIREAGFNVPVAQHNYEDESNLVYVGKTGRGSPVHINKLYIEADLKVVTGLVESHFMAGASGGRKAICPAIASKQTLRIFHGPEILDSPNAADLMLDGNPCSEEAEQAAGLVGCDFAVNVTLDAAKNITGIFSGDISASHRAAVEKIREYVVVHLQKRYDLVLIPAGFVGVNHYQAAKAAIEASRAVKPGGMIVIVARHSDPDPIGSQDYKQTLALLKRVGPSRFLQTIKSPDWVFTHDQWETQMWCKVLGVVKDESNLIYCSLEIPDEDYSILPCVPGHAFLSREALKRTNNPESRMRQIVEQAVLAAIQRLQNKLGAEPEVLFLKDGPYGVPKVLP